MNILAVDTATPVCSAAVCRDGGIRVELSLHTGKSHATRLMGLIRTVLDHSGMTLQEIDGFAVGQGPGSFTGLRIGVGTMKGLAAASGKPLLGVSTLEALAWQSNIDGFTVCPMIDARRGEVYTARYAASGGVFSPCFPESVLPPEKALAGVSTPCIIVGTGALLYRDLFQGMSNPRVQMAPEGQHWVRAATVARLARGRFEGIADDSAARMVPRYIRKSYAEAKDARVRCCASPESVR